MVKKRTPWTCHEWNPCFLTRTFPLNIRVGSVLNGSYCEKCALLCYYAASSGKFLPAFRDNPSVPYFLDSLSLKMGPIGCPETSVRNYHYSLRKSPEELSSHLLRGRNCCVLLKLLCCSMYCLFCVVLCTACVKMCTVLLPPGVNPIAVNKYIIS